MRRRRYLSTDISGDDRVDELAQTYGDFAALLYTWMIPHAADDATITSNLKRLMWTVIPSRRDKTEAEVEDAIGGMLALGLLDRVPGQALLQFPPAAFYRYQTYVHQSRRVSPQNAEDQRSSENFLRSTASVKPSVKPSPSHSVSPPTVVAADAPTPPSLSKNPVKAVFEAPATVEPAVRTVPKPAPPTALWQIFEGYCTGLDLEPETIPRKHRERLLGQAKDLVEHYTPEQVEGCTRYLRTHRYWHDKLTSLHPVLEEIAQWVQAGCPAAWTADTSKNGHGPNGRPPPRAPNTIRTVNDPALKPAPGGMNVDADRWLAERRARTVTPTVNQQTGEILADYPDAEDPRR